MWRGETGRGDHNCTVSSEKEPANAIKDNREAFQDWTNEDHNLPWTTLPRLTCCINKESMSGVKKTFLWPPLGNERNNVIPVDG